MEEVVCEETTGTNSGGQTELTKGVVDRIRVARETRGWSMRELGQRCAAAGYPISCHILANLETGRRDTLTIDELFILAKVLGVQVMFFPGVGSDLYTLEQARQLLAEQECTASGHKIYSLPGGSVHCSRCKAAFVTATEGEVNE